jgi:hypothetical protein
MRIFQIYFEPLQRKMLDPAWSLRCLSSCKRTPRHKVPSFGALWREDGHARGWLGKSNCGSPRPRLVFQYPQTRARIEDALGAAHVEFVLPANHKEALEVLGQHKVMLDTFPYSSGLTAREAQAMGVRVQAKVGKLFCERHCAHL